MKKIIFSLSLLLLVALQAASAATPPTSLKDAMDDMNVDMKAIAKAVGNASQNQASAALADDFVSMVGYAKTFVPDVIAKAPTAQQADLTTQYQQDLDQVADLGTQLAAAFRANNNTQAASLLQQLAAAKTTGHNQFNPPKPGQ